LRSVHNEFADKGLVVLSISLDENAASAKNYATKKNMHWQHGFAPGAWKSEAAEKFGIREIPSVWFIGADGKIKARDLPDKEISKSARLLLENKLLVIPEPLLTVSGLVVDDTGQPIAEAEVIIFPSFVNVCADQEQFLKDWTFRTDKNGIWTCKMKPEAKSISIGVHHPLDAENKFVMLPPIRVKENVVEIKAEKQ
jgi:hypothetical protein